MVFVDFGDLFWVCVCSGLDLVVLSALKLIVFTNFGGFGLGMWCLGLV